MRRKIYGIGMAGLAALSLLAGCGGSYDKESYVSSAMDAGYAMEAPEEVMMEDAAASGSYGLENNSGADTSVENKQTKKSDRKLIKTVDLSAETKEFDTMIDEIIKRTQMCGGYVESSNTYNGSRYSSYVPSRSASLVLRIPQEKLDEFLEAVSVCGNIVQRSDSVRDVTLTYVDIESRKKALETEQERLLILMEQAETIEDLLTIEQRLTDIRYQLQTQESQLRTYDNQVDYSTVNLNVEEVKELTPVVEQTAWQRIQEGFTNQLIGVIDAAGEFMIWFIIHIPDFIGWAVVLCVIYYVIKAVRAVCRRREQKKAGKKQMDTKRTEKENRYRYGRKTNPAAKQNEEQVKEHDSENK